MNTLSYLYIYDLKGYFPFEINFSNHFVFNMGGDKILRISKTVNPMEGLLGDNIYDINIIAGENGVGKTTLIKLIANLLTEKNHGGFDGDFKYFALFNTGENELKVKTSGKNPFAYDHPETIEVTPEDSRLDLGRPIIYYSPFLDFNLLETFNTNNHFPLIDLSSTQVIAGDLDEHYSEEEADDLDTMEVESHPLIQHKLKNTKRQVAFMNTYAGEFELPFVLPKQLEVRFHRLSVNSDDVSGNGNTILERFRSLAAEYFRGYPENRLSKKNMAKLMFLRNLLTLYFAAINKDKSQSILHHRFDAKLSEEIERFNDKSPHKLIELMESFFETEDVFGSDIFRKLISLIGSKISAGNVFFSDSNNLLTLFIDTRDAFLGEIFKILNTPTKKQGREKHIISGLSKFISFDWSNFSSGEKMFIDLFSRLSDCKKKLGSKKQPVLLLIDEGEMGFHPLWQIKYISTLRDFVNEIFFDYDFQILLATHSPLVLSDFPSERVHLFKKNARGIRAKTPSIGTFGQNISELLANEFFIESTLIGNLAKEYINNILEEIDQYRKNISPKRYRNLLSRIEKIDDPIIYKLLIAQLEDEENA